MHKLLSGLRGFALFAMGVVVGTLLMPSTRAQNTGAPNSGSGAMRLNHVGIAVTDFQKSLDFYTKVMGFRFAYQLPGANGRPGTAFLQISRDTFLEMALASDAQHAGLTHIGLITDDHAATLAQLRQAGATVPDFRPPSVTGALVSNVTDLDMIHLELVEHPAGSWMRKAMDGWK